MYAYITQGRPDACLLRPTPRAQTILTNGIGVYATPLLQPTQTTTRIAQGNPVYIYQPTKIARMPIPSDTNIIFFTNESGNQYRTPTVGCASERITRCADGLHVEHHTGATIFGASTHGELRILADTVSATPTPTATQPRNIWLVVDTTVDIHRTKHLAELPLHKALESGLTTQALGLWMAFRGMQPQDALHIVKEESHCYSYGNGCADTHAKNWNSKQTPGLEHVRLDTTHYSHLQHVPPIPTATRPPHWVPEDTPYTDKDKQYHYATPILQLATTLGRPANPQLIPRRLRTYPPLIRGPTPGQPPGAPTKTTAPARPRATTIPHPRLQVVCLPLHPHPHRIHQVHLRPHGGRDLGPLQDLPAVPGVRHPHRLEPVPHHRTARRMANMVHDGPATPHQPSAATSARSSPHGACPDGHLHPTTHPRGGPPGPSSTHATNGYHQNGHTTHVPYQPVPIQHAATLPPTDQTELLKLIFYQL